MLAHQRVDAAALAALECVDDCVVLPMRVLEDVVVALETGPVERDRLRSRKRHVAVALEGLGQ